MKQTLVALFILSLFATQAATASNVSKVSSFGLTDTVMAADAPADKAEGDKKKKKKKKEDEPDCE